MGQAPVWNMFEFSGIKKQEYQLSQTEKSSDFVLTQKE